MKQHDIASETRDLRMTEAGNNVHVRHATKSNNFVAQLWCSTKLPVWYRELPNFWWVARL